MQSFWSLFKESVIVQAIIATMLLGTICYMYATGQKVPDTLVIAFGTVLGFYFGSKTQASIMRR